MKKTIEKYLQARDEVSFKYNKAGAKIWYRAHANIETGVIDTGKANGWSCDHDIKINRFQAALILEKYGLTIEQFIDAEKEFYATRYPETNNITEANPDDYAVSPDALEVAVNAEIQNANNEQNDEAIEAEFIAAQNEVYRLQDEMNALIGTPDYFVTQNEYHAAWQRYELALAKAQQASRRRMTALLNTEPANTPKVDPIIQERDTARNEYDQLNQVRKVIENDVERFERLRDRCKANSPKHKEYNQLLESFDPIIRAFGEKFIAAQDRYNKSLTLRTDEEKAATQKAIDEHNKDLDARGIKYFATVYYYPNGIEGEDMETFHKDCTSLDEANAFVSQEDHDGVYVGGIYDAGWQITDRNHNLIADHTTGIKEDFKTTTNTIAAKAIT